MIIVLGIMILSYREEYKSNFDITITEKGLIK